MWAKFSPQMKSISKNLSKLFPSVSSRLLPLRFFFNVGVLFLIVCCRGILKLLSLSLSLSLSLQQPVLVGLVGSVAAADHQVVEIWISSWNLSRILFSFFILASMSWNKDCRVLLEWQREDLAHSQTPVVCVRLASSRFAVALICRFPLRWPSATPVYSPILEKTPKASSRTNQLRYLQAPWAQLSNF